MIHPLTGDGSSKDGECDRQREPRECGSPIGGHCGPALEAAKRRWPVAASVTTRAFAMLGLSRARKPSTVTTSPMFIDFRVQPALMRAFGLPISIPQFVTVPASFLTSM